MNDDGLQKSIWSPYEDSNSFRRSGDWVCPSCGVSNFAWRKLCFRCPSTCGSNGVSANGHLPPSTCTNHQISTSFNEDKQVQPAESTALWTTRYTNHREKNKEPGLATSRWAPRNYRGRPISSGVWTRTIAKPQNLIPSSTPKPPDLGLPYEVQHYILAMIQRIIEEACYDLASRWIPQKLCDNRWDCAEAVELSTWRDVLPTALPPAAIVPLPTYSLETALADAVKIRNAAVHRHLCDNTEIRYMVVRAQEIMMMFSDSTRRNQFHRLWIELNNWDQSSDHQTAKEELLLLLQEISDRPIDDMDWSPNAVSLQEVTDDRQGVNHYYGEEMELD